MLTVLGAILGFIFAWLIPIAIGIFAGVCLIMGVVLLMQAGKGFSFLEKSATAFTMAGLCFAFFVLQHDFIEKGYTPDTDLVWNVDKGYSEVVPMPFLRHRTLENTSAGGLVMIWMFFIIALNKGLKVPYVILVWIVWGVLLFGF